jgi:hypothetical protein
MKKNFLIVSLALMTATSLLAQDKPSFFQKQVLGKGVEQNPLQLSLDAYPFLYLANGGGGSASIEFSNWQVGVIGFSVVPPDFITQTFFNNTDNLKIKRNNAVELFANYYLRKDRKGIYGGVMGGPEWFVMEDKISGETETTVKSYVIPRLGFRAFPFKEYFYADASFGWSFNLSGTEPRTLGQTTYNATSGGFIYFLQLGVRFNLTKNQE